MSEAAPLERDMIAQPGLWRLVMLVGARRLDVTLLPPVESESLIYRSLLLDPEAPNHTKAVEEAIYGNPLLLSDFRTVTCLIDTRQALVVPSSLDADDRALLLRRAFLLDEAEPISARTADPAADVVMAMDRELEGFLRRTFYNVRFEHSLAPLTRALVADPTILGPRIYALCRREGVDVVAADGQRLLMANSFECESSDDAAYYVLAVRQVLGLDPQSTAIVTGGIPARSAALHASLGRVPDTPTRPYELPPLRFKTAGTADFPLQSVISSLNHEDNKR